MGYSIEITEVGPAEYPLLEVLQEIIFRPFDHHYGSTITQLLEGKMDVLCLMAHLEGNPVGFKIGCAERPGVYHSRRGGVLAEYRRQGLALRLQDWQHQFARARGYQKVLFNTFNHFPEMLRFGLRSGFAPVAVSWRERTGPSIQMLRSFADAEPVWSNARSIVLPAAQSIEIPSDDRRQLHSLISQGWRITGMRDGGARAPIVLFAPPV